jgi:hypothetical protein
MSPLLPRAASAAAAEVVETRRMADADRPDAHRLRAVAEAYAKDTRAAARRLRGAADRGRREAAQILENARTRLQAADAEVEQKVREAQAIARQRVDLLQVEAERYEERLESIFVVFRGISSQLEELLGKPRTESGDLAEPSDEALDDALRRDSSSSRVG